MRASLTNTALITSDPNFIIASHLLLGKYNLTRIVLNVSSPVFFEQNLKDSPNIIHSIICDADTMDDSDSSREALQKVFRGYPSSNLLWVGIAPQISILPIKANLPIRGILSKTDLRYCLHLAVRAAQEKNYVWLTDGLFSKLEILGLRRDQCQLISPEKAHPNMSERIQEVLVLRVVIGLDNREISEELGLEYNTVRDYVSQG